MRKSQKTSYILNTTSLYYSSYTFQYMPKFYIDVFDNKRFKCNYDTKIIIIPGLTPAVLDPTVQRPYHQHTKIFFRSEYTRPQARRYGDPQWEANRRARIHLKTVNAMVIINNGMYQSFTNTSVISTVGLKLGPI